MSITRVFFSTIPYLLYSLAVYFVVPDDFRNWQSALLLMGIVQYLTRRGLDLARWLYQARRIDYVGYLLAHIIDWLNAC